MPTLRPPTLTEGEQRTILRATAGHPRDHLVYSLALGTGLRLAEIVDLNVGDVFAADGKPRSRVTIRAEIANDAVASGSWAPANHFRSRARRTWRRRLYDGRGN